MQITLSELKMLFGLLHTSISSLEEQNRLLSQKDQEIQALKVSLQQVQASQTPETIPNGHEITTVE